MLRLLSVRLLGVGLAAAIAALTVVLALTGQLDLYINPSSAWLAVPMAVFALLGAVASFLLPLGAEADHGHDHGDAHDGPRADAGAHRLAHREHPGAPDHDAAPDHGSSALDSHRHDAHHHGVSGGRVLGGVAVVSGGILAVGVTGAMLVVPPATLSAEIAMTRDTGAAPLFRGADNVALAVTGDTSSFGVGEWANVFATATNPEAFDGDQISVTGFVTPGDEGFGLSRLVVTHCVIDAQSATIDISAADAPATGQWVTVTGTIRDVDGSLQVTASSVEEIDQPQDPYEY